MCRMLVWDNRENDFGIRKTFQEALMLMKNGGPDKTTITEIDGILFGHNRLSIVDLSEAADQPYISDAIVLMFNGEIYNYKELRENLDCKTDSEIEVLGKLVEKKLKEGGRFLSDEQLRLDEIDGEYAIIVYDRKNKRFLEYTDIMGVKPLFASRHLQIGGNIWSSEEKAIEYICENPKESFEWLYQGLQFGYPLHSKSKMTGSFVHSQSNKRRELLGTVGLPPTTSEVMEAVNSAVVKRLQSDVPIACLLSGGIDSAIVAHIMQKNSDAPIKTYTLAFAGLDNELEDARRTAELLGTDHTEIIINPKEILANIDDIIDTMEGPFDRGSLIPTYFLAKHVKEKVVLVGEGADEVFGGYKRHTKEAAETAYIDTYEYYKEYLEVFSDEELGIGRKENYYYFEHLTSGIKIPTLMDLAVEIPYFHCRRLDRCFMRFGKEARVPYLDPEVVKCGVKQIVDFHTVPKKRLRDAFAGELPEEILSRPKKPLKLPFEYMIELPEVKEYILSREIEPFKTDYIQSLYDQPSGSRNRGRKLWAIYLLGKYYERKQKICTDSRRSRS